jgi:hypothetical protein
MPAITNTENQWYLRRKKAKPYPSWQGLGSRAGGPRQTAVWLISSENQ